MSVFATRTGYLVIVFMDVHNFSAAQRLLAEQACHFLQAMYEALGDLVLARQGRIVKYLGDAMLCVFPAGSEKDAVACSLELRKAFAGLVSRYDLPPDTDLEVGISSGEVTTGIFGHSSLRQWDVFGEEVNLAATIGHHRGIAVTGPVNAAIKAHYSTRPLPDLQVKWQAEPLKIWEVVA